MVNRKENRINMLIDFRKLFPKWNINPKGVLHVGANVGEEAPVYDEMGIKKVIWIEGNPDLKDLLEKNISKYSGQKAYIQCISDENIDTVLHISNNGSQSSSILDLGTHKIVHPDVHYVKDIPVSVCRIDDLFAPNGWGDLKDIDFVNIDVQGAELKVLRGMGNLIDQFKWAYLEVNKAELYKGCVLVDDLDLFMLGKGFRRMETFWCGNTNWGDALYIKQ